MILVDTNVLLDIVTNDATWADWSIETFKRAVAGGPVVINPVIYAEFSARFERMEQVDQFLEDAGIELTNIPRESLFLAGKAFLDYRRQGGLRTGVLPDFFIGAHAHVSGLPLLTRDTRRYRGYFPNVRLIAPA